MWSPINCANVQFNDKPNGCESGGKNQENIRLRKTILVIVYIWASVKIVRTGLGPGNRQRHYPLRLHRDNVILIL